MPAFLRILRSFVSAAALVTLAIGVAARGDVLTSNMTDPPDGGSFVTSAFPQRAQAFSTTATGTQIATVKLDITSSTVAQPFSIRLFSSGTAGLPDTSLATLFSGSGGDIIFGTSPFTISGLNLALEPSTTYFVVMQYGGGSFSGQWNYNTETTGSGPGFLPNNSYAQTSIDNWQAVSTSQPYRMEIVVVPEPPAIVLSGIGLASAMCLLRRPRR